MKFINIHTHQSSQNEHVFALQNTILSKDYLQQAPCSLGIHPWYIDIDHEKQLQTLEVWARKEQVIAIGECGLDKLTHSNWDKQIYVFEKQIELAKRLDKPMILHCVRAYQETLELLAKQQVKPAIIFHGFNKNIELAYQLIRKNYHLSLGADILNGQFDEHIQKIPLDKIFLETDNKSTDIVDIYSYFCSVREITIEQLQSQIIRNFERLFTYNIIQ